MRFDFVGLNELGVESIRDDSEVCAGCGFDQVAGLERFGRHPLMVSREP